MASEDLRRRFVFLHHRLYAVLRIATRTDQVLLRIIHFVLAQLQLRLGQIEPVVQRILLGSAGLSFRGRKLRDLRLFRRQSILRLLQPRLYLLCLGGQYGRMLGRVEHRKRKRQVHFLIPKLQSSLCERQLHRAGWHVREHLCG